MNNNQKKPVGPPKPKAKTIKRLVSYVTDGYRLKFIMVLVCILISAIAGVRGSLFIQEVIDDHITPMMGMENPVFTGLLKAVFSMATIYGIGILSTFIYNRFMVDIAQGVLKQIRDDMFTHMQTLPIGYFDSNSTGDIMSRYTSDTDTLRQMIAQSLPQVFSSIVTIISVFFAMISTNVYLTILVLATVTFMLAVAKKIIGQSGKYFIKQQREIGKANGYIEEMINGQKVVKVFCYEDETKAKFSEINEDLRDAAGKANTFANILMPFMGNIGYIQYVLVATVGSYLAINGIAGTTVGSIATFLQLSRTFNMPISQVSQQLNAVIMALAGAERIFDLMDQVSEEDQGTVTLVNVERKGSDFVESKKRTGIWAWKVLRENNKVEYVELKGDVRFIDVDFGYSPKKKILKNINLYAEPGQKVAFVGATGAGKTTITNLINRFYDINEGQILYDGIDIKDIKKDDLRNSLGIVLQDTNLFTGTVKENIRYGKLDATDEEVYDAAKRANAHDFIMMLPDGYDTFLAGDGSDLSQGQRQLLSIARAQVANTPVMILDEATSSIDTRTESIVQKGMDALMAGRTVFVIAHRLSTVQNSDVIMVLEQGEIIERGSHDSLVAEKGKYYQLYTGAFELE